MMLCPECIFVVTLHYQMVQIGKLFEEYQYLGSFLVKIWVFDTLGWPYIGLPLTVLQLILKKYHHALSWMYFCGYVALSNGANWEVIWIIPIFGVIFGQNLGIWPPGWPAIGSPHCFAINFEEIPSCFVLNVFCGYFELSNGPNWDVIWIIPIFGVIFGQNLGIWPPGWPYIGLPPTVVQLILKKYHHALSWMYFCGYFALSNGPNLEVIWIIPIFGVIFGQNFGIWPPGVTIYRVTATVLQLVLKK
jgi:hypothetical protein